MDTRLLGTAVRRPRRTARLAVGLSLAAIAVVAPVGATSAASGASSGTRTAMTGDTYEAKVELYVNQRRAAHGLKPLRFESCADMTAERWAARIASTGKLVHQSTGSIMDTCHASYAGETLGRGRFGARRLLKKWMRSPLHRAVVLSPRAKRIGVGSHLDGSGRWVTSANFTRR